MVRLMKAVSVNVVSVGVHKAADNKASLHDTKRSKAANVGGLHYVVIQVYM